MTRKRLTSIFSLCYIGLTFSQAWTTSKPHIFASFNDMACPDSNTVYVVGAKGVIYKTTNGANTWDSLSPNTTDDIYSLACTNNNTCFALCGRSKLLKTSDGGQTWNMDTTYSQYGGSAIYFQNATTGYITGMGEGKFLKTIDGGVTWNVVTSNLNDKYIKQVYFTSATNGFALSQNYDRQTQISTGLIYKTTDGGLTWNEVYNLPNKGFNDIQFPTATIGFAVGINGTILKTGDGGTNWVVQNSITTNNLRAIYFIDQNIGYITGKGTVLKTNNRGVNWSNLNIGNNYLYYSIYFINSNIGYLQTAGNLILKTTTGGF